MTAPAYPLNDDPLAWRVATELAACFCEQIAQTSKPVGCCCVMPGQEVAWDACDPGMAWVRVVQVYAMSGQFPVPATGQDQGPCGAHGGWGVVLELGAIRCVPVPSPGKPVPCTGYTQATRVILADAHAMRRAVDCCPTWIERGRVEQYQVGAWVPVGPQGGCAGGTLQVTVQVNGCVCDNQTGTGTGP